MRIIFRADGNATIGLGHFVRSLALAEMMKTVAPCWFAVQNPSEAMRTMLRQAQVAEWALPKQPIAAEAAALRPQLHATDIVVLDGYSFDTAYQQAIRASGCRLVVIDDLRAGPVVADLVINHSPGVTPAMYQAEAHTRFCLGPEYSLLRPAFLAGFRRPEPVAAIRKVLLCFGGADPQQLTRRCLAALLPLPQIAEVGVLVGAASPHMAELRQQAAGFPARHVEFYPNASAPEMVELLRRHDAVLCPASTILIESLFLGKPVITGYYVENQQHLAAYVHVHQQAHSLGDFRALAGQALQRALAEALAGLEQQPRQPYLTRPRTEQLREEFRRLLPAPA